MLRGQIDDEAAELEALFTLHQFVSYGPVVPVLLKHGTGIHDGEELDDKGHEVLANYGVGHILVVLIHFCLLWSLLHPSERRA